MKNEPYPLIPDDEPSVPSPDESSVLSPIERFDFIEHHLLVSFQFFLFRIRRISPTLAWFEIFQFERQIAHVQNDHLLEAIDKNSNIISLAQQDNEGYLLGVWY